MPKFWAEIRASMWFDCVDLTAVVAVPRNPPRHCRFRIWKKSARRSVSRVLSAPQGLVPGEGMTIHLGRPLPNASCNRPGRRCGNSPAGRTSLPPLFGFAPGGVYLAAPVARRAVRSYRTLSPLPFSAETSKGGLLSVALSLGSPPPGVTRHRVTVEPGLSSLACKDESSHPTVWPSEYSKPRS